MVCKARCRGQRRRATPTTVIPRSYMITIVHRSLLAVGALTVLLGCQSETPTTPPAGARAPLAARAASASDLLDWLGRYIAKPHRRHRTSSDGPALLAGAGDIARCY